MGFYGIKTKDKMLCSPKSCSLKFNSILPSSILLNLSSHIQSCPSLFNLFSPVHSYSILSSPFQPLQPYSFLSFPLQYFQHCPLIFNLALFSSILTMHIQSCPYFFKFINPFHSFSLLYSIKSSLLQTCPLLLFNPLLPSSTC